MNDTIRRLEDIRKEDTAVAGGKGANLGELIANGFPVPPGFVVSAQACRDFFKSIALQELIEDLKKGSPDDYDKKCITIRKHITDAEMPESFKDPIIQAYADLERQRGHDIICAVRSSGTAEDLGDASFAGQHATYYYVDRNHLLQMIKHCWASLWSAEAVSYRDAQGIDHASVFMAVVVQEMILSEISGVTFSANPVTGNTEEIVTESSWGMGAAIVDGRVTPDRYIMEKKTSAIIEKRIAEKKFMVTPRIEKNEKTRLKEVPHDLRQKETLSIDQVRMVAKWAIKAEKHFQSHQDIEWAIAEGQFFMLQSRPITIMGKDDVFRDIKGKYVLFKAFIENFTEPLTPLTVDILETLMPPSIKIIQGWVYIDLKYVKPLLPFKLSDEEVADLVYMSYGNRPPSMKLSVLKLPGCCLIFFFLYLLMGVPLIRSRRMPDSFMDQFRDLCRQVERDQSLGPVGSIIRLWSGTRFFDPIGKIVMLVNWTTAMRYPIWQGLLDKMLHLWAPGIPEGSVDLLYSGSEGVLSADMGRGIWLLAAEAKKNDIVSDIITKQKPNTILDKLKSEPQARIFLENLSRFLSKHGHRAMKEVELQSVRWEEDPSPVIGMVRNYLLVDCDPTEHEQKIKQIREELEADIYKKLEQYPLERTFRLRWRLVRYARERAKYFTKQRENSRFYHIMAFYTVRKKILGIEKDLMQTGKLKCKNDIFFLNKDELGDLKTGKIDWPGVENVVRERRMAHIRLSKMIPPKMLNIEVKAKSKGKETMADGRTMLTGQTASPGECTGIARVIMDPAIDMELKPGEILVAPYTDPAWTPLFLTAGAAVIEVGSYLSHAGTVAREFGMPCVVDVSDCTRRIHSGIEIEVDGDRGVVRLCSDKGGEHDFA